MRRSDRTLRAEVAPAERVGCELSGDRVTTMSMRLCPQWAQHQRSSTSATLHGRW